MSTKKSFDLEVFSFGSAGSDTQQLYPNFVASHILNSNNISNNNIINNAIINDENKNHVFVNIYNFDPLFKNCSMEKTNQTYIYYFNQTLEQKLYSKIYDYIHARLYNSNSKIVIIDHRHPLLDDFILQIGRDFQDMIGSQLEIIGSYFSDTPVFKYHKALFALGQKTDIHAVLQKAWNLWKDFPDETFRSHQYNIFSTKQLERWRKEFQSIGVLFRNLASIKSEDLFQKKTEIQNKQKQPSPIIGLSDKDYEALLQKYIYQLDDPLKISAALLKHNEIERFKFFVENQIAKDPQFLNKKNRFHRTLAHIAVSHNVFDDASIIYFLSEKGLDFSLPDKHGFTPLDFTQWKAGPMVQGALQSLILKGHN